MPLSFNNEYYVAWPSNEYGMFEGDPISALLEFLKIKKLERDLSYPGFHSSVFFWDGLLIELKYRSDTGLEAETTMKDPESFNSFKNLVRIFFESKSQG